MKQKLITLFFLFLALTSSAQTQVGSEPIDNWEIFSPSTSSQQIKKAGDKNLIAYYRLDRQHEGFLYMNPNLTVAKNIPFKLSKLDYFSTTLSQYLAIPDFIYNNSDSTIYTYGRVENTRKDQEIAYFKFNVNTGAEAGSGTLKKIGEDSNSEIHLSDNNKFVSVTEIESKGDFDNRKFDRYNYTVFEDGCKKLYTCQQIASRKAIVHTHLLNDGSIIQIISLKENKEKNITINLFNTKGIISKSVVITSNLKTSPDYYFDQFIEIPNKGNYVLFRKIDDGDLIGLYIVKLDFENGKAINIVDFALSEDILKPFYKKAPFSNNMEKPKELKLKENINMLSTYDIITDSTGFYLNLNFSKGIEIRSSKTGALRGVRYFFNDDLFISFDINGKFKWLTPLKRATQDCSLKLFGWTGGRCKLVNSDNDIRFTMPHDQNVYFAKINKNTGVISDIKPILNSKNVFTNYSTILWLNNNKIVLATLEGMPFIGNSFNKMTLRAFDFTK